jgi:hypothetical protein
MNIGRQRGMPSCHWGCKGCICTELRGRGNSLRKLKCVNGEKLPHTKETVCFIDAIVRIDEQEFIA